MRRHGGRGGVVGAGAAWGQPGGRDGADDSTGGSTDRARTPRCAAARAGRGRRGARRRGPGRRGRRRGVGAAGLGTMRRDGGLGRTSRAATVERRPGTHARPGKNAAAHAGERAGAAEEVGAAGQRRSELGGEGGYLLEGGSVSAGWYYQPALTCPCDGTLVPAGSSSRH